MRRETHQPSIDIIQIIANSPDREVTSYVETLKEQVYDDTGWAISVVLNLASRPELMCREIAASLVGHVIIADSLEPSTQNNLDAVADVWSGLLRDGEASVRRRAGYSWMTASMVRRIPHRVLSRLIWASVE